MTKLINRNGFDIPDNTIVVFTENEKYDKFVFEIVEPLCGKINREWFVSHAYNCLPLTIGNQYGFVIKSLRSFDMVWNGGNSKSDIKITYHDSESLEVCDSQFITSHFGMGVVTIQNRFHFRTPPNINLFTLDPPNHLLPGFRNLNAAIETDNLRRDFTFNIRLTDKDRVVSIKKGDLLSAFFPIPRFFVDSFVVQNANTLFDDSIINQEREQGLKFGEERRNLDPYKNSAGVGRRYYAGMDADNNPFLNHQQKIKCPSKKEELDKE